MIEVFINTHSGSSIYNLSILVTPMSPEALRGARRGLF
jgi:hypothetical protein